MYFKKAGNKYKKVSRVSYFYSVFIGLIGTVIIYNGASNYIEGHHSPLGMSPYLISIFTCFVCFGVGYIIKYLEMKDNNVIVVLLNPDTEEAKEKRLTLECMFIKTLLTDKKNILTSLIFCIVFGAVLARVTTGLAGDVEDDAIIPALLGMFLGACSMAVGYNAGECHIHIENEV